jgi:hypothetical protein
MSISSAVHALHGRDDELLGVNASISIALPEKRALLESIDAKAAKCAALEHKIAGKESR